MSTQSGDIEKIIEVISSIAEQTRASEMALEGINREMGAITDMNAQIASAAEPGGRGGQQKYQPHQ